MWDLSHHASVDRYPNNIYKGFEDVEQAVDYFQNHGITEDDIAIYTTTNIRHGHSLQQLRANAQQHGETNCEESPGDFCNLVTTREEPTEQDDDTTHLKHALYSSQLCPICSKIHTD